MQQVNLLIKAPRPPVQPLHSPHLLLATGALVTLLLLVSAVQFWLSQRQANAIAVLESELAEVLATSEALANATEDERITALTADVAGMRAQLNDQRRLLHSARVSTGQAAAGYAAQMRELAQAHQPGLWLTRIQLSRRMQPAMQPNSEDVTAVQLEGLTQQPDLVPAFLRRLALAESFAGQHFSGMELRAANENMGADLHEFRIWGPVRQPALQPRPLASEVVR